MIKKMIENLSEKEKILGRAASAALRNYWDASRSSQEERDKALYAFSIAEDEFISSTGELRRIEEKYGEIPRTPRIPSVSR